MRLLENVLEQITIVHVCFDEKVNIILICFKFHELFYLVNKWSLKREIQ